MYEKERKKERKNKVSLTMLGWAIKACLLNCSEYFVVNMMNESYNYKIFM
jgi:hypothetical protein